MLVDFPSPVLNVAVDALKDLDGSEALTGLWFLFSKCQSSLNEGRRLENISWRLWYQEMAGRSSKYRPITPDSPLEFASSEGSGTSSLLSTSSRTVSTRRPSIGKIIYEQLLDSPPHTSQTLRFKFRLPIGPKVELGVTNGSSLLPTPAAELPASMIPSVQVNSNQGPFDSSSASLSTSPSTSTKSVSAPGMGSHASPPALPQSSLSSSNSGTSTPASPFPLVVVVNPTPNPTPHPTPPATPVLPATVSSDSVGHTHVQLPLPRLSSQSPKSPTDRRHPGLSLLSPATSQAQLPAAPGSRPPIPASLLPPSPSTNTSSSLLSASPLSDSSSACSHLTNTSSTSESSVSYDNRSPNATLKPHDARIFFLKRGGSENSSGSSDEPSPSRPRLSSMTNGHMEPRSTTLPSHTLSHNLTSSAVTSESGVGSGNVSRNDTAVHSPPARLSRQASDGQGSTSASGSGSGSWDETDDIIDRRSIKPSKSGRRGSASTRNSGTSESTSRSRSRGRSAHGYHDGLMMSSRRKGHHAHAVGKKGGRLAAAALHSSAHTAHPDGHGIQAHGAESTGMRAQGQDKGREGCNGAQAGSTSKAEPSRDQRDRLNQQLTHHSSSENGRHVAQASAQPVPSITPAKRPMFNIGSHSTGTGSKGSDSPSTTDLSLSSQAHLRSTSILNGERDTAIVSPPALPLSRVRTHGRLLSFAKDNEIVSQQPPHPPTVPAVAPTGSIASPRQPRGLPPATANLSAAEAMIQAPRTRKVVLADDEDDEDDWDETDTDLDSEYEDERKSDIDAEKGGTLVEPGLAVGNDNEDENGAGDEDWVSDDDSGSGDVPAPPPTAPAKTGVAPSPAAGGATNGSLKRSGPSRHYSQPNVPTVASIARQKQDETRQNPPQPPPRQYSAAPSNAGPSNRILRQREREREAAKQQAHDQKLREAAEEAQRQRDMFTKVPKRSYSNLSTRSQSGLLSQLMNPDPGIFPDSHPYKKGYSSGDVAAGGRGIGGLTRLGMQPMTSATGAAASKGGISALAAGAPSGAGKAPHPHPPYTAAPSLRPTKSTVALPVANSITASSFVGDSALKDKGKGRETQPSTSGNSGGAYRPKARPCDEEMEDESDDDPEQGLQMSKSAAHEKLAALADRRSAKPGAKTSNRAPPPPALLGYADPIAAPQPQRAQSQYVGNAPVSTPPVPVPLGFPYNLPPAAPPSTPRTTRQLMLRTEMPESLRQNLLWSRKLNKEEFAGPRRKSSTTLSPALQPMTALPAVVQLKEKKKGDPKTPGNGQDKDLDIDGDLILRPARMQRNRSWAGGGR